MNRRVSVIAFIFVFGCACLAQECAKQEPVYDSTNVYKPMDPWNSSEWVFAITPYAFAPEIDGKATLGRFTGNADTSFSTLWDHLDFAAMGRVEAFKGDWSFFIDSIYTKCTGNFDLSVPPLSATLGMHLTLAMVDVGASYKLIDEAVGQNGQRIIFTPYAGGRYAYLKEELNIDPTGPFAPLVGSRSLGGSADWVEPFVGGRVIYKFTDRFFAAVRGDAGGFGIGSASQLIWNLVGWLGYQINNNIAIEGGYRILDIDYSHGSGSDAFGLNAQLRGPVAGVTIHF